MCSFQNNSVLSTCIFALLFIIGKCTTAKCGVQPSTFTEGSFKVTCKSINKTKNFNISCCSISLIDSTPFYAWPESDCRNISTKELADDFIKIRYAQNPGKSKSCQLNQIKLMKAKGNIPNIIIS